METSPGQPIPFIEVHENEEDKNHVLVINPYAINILQEMRDKKVLLPLKNHSIYLLLLFRSPSLLSLVLLLLGNPFWPTALLTGSFHYCFLIYCCKERRVLLLVHFLKKELMVQKNPPKIFS